METKKADEWEVGDVICFTKPFESHYIIEEISHIKFGMVRHRHSNGTSSACYEADEELLGISNKK